MRLIEYSSSDDETCNNEMVCGGPVDGQEYVQPSNQDVLLGRGSKYLNHPGNIHYTEVIRDNRESYFKTDDLMTKKLVVYRIVEEILAEGRFLKHNRSTWIVVSRCEARLKVAHAIQYLQRKLHHRTPRNKRKKKFQAELSPMAFFEPNGFDMDHRIAHLGDFSGGNVLLSTLLWDWLPPTQLDDRSCLTKVEPYLQRDCCLSGESRLRDHPFSFSSAGNSNGNRHDSECDVGCDASLIESSKGTSFHFSLNDLILDNRPHQLLRCSSIGSFDPDET